MKWTNPCGSDKNKEVTLAPGLVRNERLPDGYLWLTNETGFTIDPEPQFRIIVFRISRGYEVSAACIYTKKGSSIYHLAFSIEFEGYVPRVRDRAWSVEHLIARKASLVMSVAKGLFRFKLIVRSFLDKDQEIALSSKKSYSLAEVLELFKDP